MKKIVLGVVALGVMVNVALADVSYTYIDPCYYIKKYYAACLRYEAGETSLSNSRDCRKGGDNINQVKLKLEACLIDGNY